MTIHRLLLDLSRTSAKEILTEGLSSNIICKKDHSSEIHSEILGIESSSKAPHILQLSSYYHWLHWLETAPNFSEGNYESFTYEWSVWSVRHREYISVSKSQSIFDCTLKKPLLLHQDKWNGMQKEYIHFVLLYIALFWFDAVAVGLSHVGFPRWPWVSAGHYPVSFHSNDGRLCKSEILLIASWNTIKQIDIVLIVGLIPRLRNLLHALRAIYKSLNRTLKFSYNLSGHSYAIRWRYWSPKLNRS